MNLLEAHLDKDLLIAKTRYVLRHLEALFTSSNNRSFVPRFTCGRRSVLYTANVVEKRTSGLVPISGGVRGNILFLTGGHPAGSGEKSSSGICQNDGHIAPTQFLSGESRAGKQPALFGSWHLYQTWAPMVLASVGLMTH